jgi:hypothetical protein
MGAQDFQASDLLSDLEVLEYGCVKKYIYLHILLFCAIDGMTLSIKSLATMPEEYPNFLVWNSLKSFDNISLHSCVRWIFYVQNKKDINHKNSFPFIRTLWSAHRAQIVSSRPLSPCLYCIFIPTDAPTPKANARSRDAIPIPLAKVKLPASWLTQMGRPLETEEKEPCPIVRVVDRRTGVLAMLSVTGDGPNTGWAVAETGASDIVWVWRCGIVCIFEVDVPCWTPRRPRGMAEVAWALLIWRGSLARVRPNLLVIGISRST